MKTSVKNSVGVSLSTLLLTLWSVLLLLPSPASGSDHYNLEEELPVEVEDSIPTAYRNREIQGYFRWERTGEDEDRFKAASILEYGIIRNAQVELEVPFLWGDAVKEEGIGDVKLGALYNFNQETLWIPGIALKGALEFSTKRYQLTPLTVLAAGVGAGIGDDSPEVRTTVGFQHSF